MERRQAIRTMSAAAVGIAALPAVSSGRHPATQQMSELLVRGGLVVNANGSRAADVRIRGELITEVGPGLRPGAGERIIDATDCLVMPGGIDPHTHLVGFADDFVTGTAAAVAGGITTVGTFAPPSSGEDALTALDRWAAEANRSAIADVFLHALLWPPGPQAVAAMPELVARGQPSHKVFMSRADYAANRGALIETLEAAKDAGVVTLMHCEDGQMLAAARRRLQAESRTGLRESYAESRPIIAEELATQEAVALCEFTGASVHIVHMSAARALAAARTQRTRSLPLTVETRPLYLYFTDEWLRGPTGPLYVGQPPVRSAVDVEALWAGLADGRIDLIATDHAPWTREQKLDAAHDVVTVRPGMSDLRFMLPVLYSEGVRRGRISRERFVEVTSTAAAKAFGLYPERGVVQEGSLADVTILDPNQQRIASADDDPSRSDYTLFEGWAVTGWPVTTIRRGEVVYTDGTVIGEPGSGAIVSRRPRT